ncbi:hypothetical protein JNW88_28165, partial [Micromonospora sp. ATA32]|nr:hypothetical protein [Micromonospora sp. ATA32]
RPHAITPNDQLLALLLDEVVAQGEVLRRILDRLPEPVQVQQTLVMTPRQPGRADGGGEGGPVEVTEPARPAPGGARPVSEPAPKRAPRRADDDGTSMPPPPRSGKGSGVDAWRSFASVAKVNVPDGASRDDIVAACVKARVIDAE